MEHPTISCFRKAEVLSKEKEFQCKLVQPLWKAVWRFLKKLKIEMSYHPVTGRR
jgi:hypothetical protein